MQEFRKKTLIIEESIQNKPPETHQSSEEKKKKKEKTRQEEEEDDEGMNASLEKLERGERMTLFNMIIIHPSIHPSMLLQMAGRREGKTTKG